MSFTKFAQEKDAASFREAFLERIQSAVADEIEQQKIAVAQSMFGDDYQLEEETSDEELDEYLDSLSEEELEALAEEVEFTNEAVRAWIGRERDSVMRRPADQDERDKLAKDVLANRKYNKGAKIGAASGKVRRNAAGLTSSQRNTKVTRGTSISNKELGSKKFGVYDEEVEQMTEAKKPKFKVGDRVRVNLPGTPAHGHEGKVSDVWKTGQVSVRLGKPGKYVSGKWKFAPKHKGADNFGNSTTVHHSNLEHLPEEVEQIAELSNKLMQRAIDKANAKADRAYDKGHEYSGREYEDQAGRIQIGKAKRSQKKFIQRDLGSMSSAKRRKAEAKRSREPVVTNDD
jgi:hypothetical protein